ncbi:MAG TPA: hypothetical protein VEC35_14360 [Noviherbaspirillum sp.]|nr:hypothetical protein [Noviherbaspirillum sp.]
MDSKLVSCLTILSVAISTFVMMFILLSPTLSLIHATLSLAALVA